MEKTRFLIVLLVAWLSLQCPFHAGADEDSAPAYGDGIHTDLQVASWLGDSQRVLALLEAGVPVDGVDAENGATPLMFATAGGHLEVMETLLGYGADLNALSSHESPPISYAILYEEHSAAQLLIAAGLDVNRSWFGGNTPLLAASYRGDVAMMSIFIEAGADLSARYANGVCALSAASANGNPDAVRMLLGFGLEVETANNHGSSPLMFAAINGHPEVLRLLLDAGSAVDAARTNGDTPLMRAAAGGCRECIEILLNAGAAVDARSTNGANAVMYAAWHGHEDLPAILVAHGADVHAADQRGATALSYAARQGHAGTIARLLELGAEIDHPDSSGMTALMLAAKSDCAGCVVELLEAGANHTVRTSRDLEAIDIAMINGSENSVVAMIQSGLLDGVSEERLDGLLHKAIASRLTRGCLVQLLDLGANPSSTGAQGATPLHVAAGAGHADAIELLLEAGVEVYAVDEHGFTPMLRTKFAPPKDGRVRAVSLLASAGPDFVNYAEDKPLREWMSWAAMRMPFDAFAGLARETDYLNQLDEEALEYFIERAGKLGNFDKMMVIMDEVGFDERTISWALTAGLVGANSAVEKGYSLDDLAVLFEAAEANNKHWPEGEMFLHTADLSPMGMAFVLAMGVDPNAVDSSGTRPLGIAMRSRSDSLERMRILLEHGADPDFTERGRSGVDMAVSAGRVDQLSVLLAAGAEVGAHSRDANWFLAAMNHEGMLELLIEHGLDVTNQSGDRSVVHLAVRRACDVANRMSRVANPDWIAIQQEKFEDELSKIRRLHVLGFLIDAKDSRGYTPLMHAMHGDVFRLLIELGADIDAVDMHGRGLLQIVLQSGSQFDASIVKMLCERESAWDAALESGFNPLEAAVAGDDLEILEQVIATAPDIDMPGDRGRTALFLAFERYVQALTSLHGIPLEQVAHSESAIEHYTKRVDLSRRVIDRLIEAGADSLHRTKSGETIAHGRVNIEALRLLVEHGCDVNARDRAARTPLHAAAQRRDAVSLRALLDFGADPLLADENGRLAIDYLGEPADATSHGGSHDLHEAYRRVYWRLKALSLRE